MMQSVNFYLEEYRPKPLSFDSRFALLALVASLIMFIGFGIFKSNHLHSQQQQLSLKQAELKKLESDQLVIQQQMRTNNEKASIDEKIATRQKSLTSFRKILANMSQPGTQVSTPYSQILQQLGEQKSQSVWLTQININSQSLSLQGSSTQTEAIPHYVELLRNSESLKRQFDELKVERDQSDSRYVNFSLTNGRLSDDG
ncbi:hypothetical protein FLL45_17655 [Aliikangiella marina]|uniref:PilN domain-containing protein n=1 Tax=Aliikangiella marina TaxID=1712262 RepID=A0A545T4A2_9GAMM|nr:PilN domain-containing protein [Aliikangiella marina]TQV71996.1 hypothetical protein FLL45_17375 [Aliikangiella marina]TQV72049.1 hypothetical protein FLL45_17655 [Aliikangiella marina]